MARRCLPGTECGELAAIRIPGLAPHAHPSRKTAGAVSQELFADESSSQVVPVGLLYQRLADLACDPISSHGAISVWSLARVTHCAPWTGHLTSIFVPELGLTAAAADTGMRYAATAAVDGLTDMRPDANQ